MATSLTTTEPGATQVAPAAETASAATAAREKASIEARALVAMHRPRDFDTARLRLLKACKRPKFAEAARYAKPVGGKTVDGLSIRFAEEARVLWGNIDVSAYLVFDDDERRVYRVVGVDLETNASDGVDVMIEKFVERRSPRQGDEVIRTRTNSQGQPVSIIRANEDALLVKVNAHIAKARRQVILSLIPADVKEECEAECIHTVRDRDAKDPEGAKKAVLEAFFELGVTPSQIAEFLGHPIEQMNPAELHVLRKVYTGIKDGEATWTDVMELKSGNTKEAQAAKSKAEEMREKMAKAKQGATPAPKPAAGSVDAELAAELARQDADDNPA